MLTNRDPMTKEKATCPFCGGEIDDLKLASKVGEKWTIYETSYEAILGCMKGYLEYNEKYGMYSKVKEQEEWIERFEKRWKEVNTPSF